MASDEEAADESQHVQRARDKLKAQISKESKQFNPERLQEVSKVMQRWIDRHQSDRVPLKDKIGLWDANQKSAKLNSNFVRDLRSGLRAEVENKDGEDGEDSENTEHEPRPLSDWRGRIRNTSEDEPTEE